MQSNSEGTLHIYLKCHIKQKFLRSGIYIMFCSIQCRILKGFCWMVWGKSCNTSFYASVMANYATQALKGFHVDNYAGLDFLQSVRYSISVFSFRPYLEFHYCAKQIYSYNNLSSRSSLPKLNQFQGIPWNANKTIYYAFL